MSDDRATAGCRLAGRYRLDAQIAAGGTSVVWRAHDERIDRAVAVKVPVSPDARFDPERLRAEARITASIDHPAVVEVYDYGQAVTSSGRVLPFAVMPLLAGVPLGARLADGPLPWREALTVASRVADVLVATHRAGVVHQDVSAENVLLTDQGAVVLDFGLAVEVGSSDPVGRYAGTAPYVAPERAAGAPPQPAGDVYSLGVLLFEMLTGGRPYPETTWEEVVAVTREGTGPRPDGRAGVPREVSALCGRMLAADPGDRPEAVECRTTLDSAVATARSGRALVATAVVGAAAVVLAAVLLNPSDRASDDRSTNEGGAVPGDVVPLPDRHSKGGAEDTTDDKVAGDGESQDGAGRDVGAGEATADPAVVALDAFFTSLDDGLSSGVIRPDVHLDLAQVASNLYRDGEYAADGLNGLRRKLNDRYYEGALDRSVWVELHADIDGIAAAVG